MLDEVIQTVEGHVDAGFWRSFFRYQGGSGPSELTGWILTLFPYIKTFGEGGEDRERLVPNPHIAQWQSGLRAAEERTGWSFTPQGPGLGLIPSSIASAPVKFVDARDDSIHPLRFVAGLFGIAQDATSGALAPELGWGIVHDGG